MNSPTQSRYVNGDWDAICDRCGFRYKASELVLDHDGYRVCQTCFEPQHPYETLRVPRENPSVPWARPESFSQFAADSGIGIWRIGISFQVPPYRDVESLTADGSVVRVTCLDHGFTNLDTITIRDASDSAYNGTFTMTWQDLNHFIYTADSAPAADEDPASGVTADGIIKDVNLVTFNRWLAREWSPS